MAGFMPALHTPSGARRCFAFGARPLAGLAPMPSALNRKNTYRPATWARLAMTGTSATIITQPPAHPDLGPNARGAQVKVVPQSGSAEAVTMTAVETRPRAPGSSLFSTGCSSGAFIRLAVAMLTPADSSPRRT